MKLKDIIANVDRSKENLDEIDFMYLGPELGLNNLPWVNAEDSRLKAYWFTKWMCTDTYVGGRVLFLDDEVVGVSYQTGRKSDINYEWLSIDLKLKVFNYLISLDDSFNEDNILNPDDLEVDWKAGYSVSYGSQLLTNTVYYENELVEIIKTNKDYGYIDKWRFVDIEKSNGETLEVDLIDVTVPFHLKK